MAEIGIFPTDGGAMRHHSIEIGEFQGSTSCFHGLMGRDLLAHYDFRLTACESFSLIPV